MKLRKIKQKTKSKTTLQKVRKYMQERYVQIVRYLNSDAIGAEENVLYLLKHEPNFYAEIEQLKDAQALKKKQQLFNEIDMKQSEIERYQKLLYSDLLKIADSIEHECKKQSTSDIALKQRTTHIAKLQYKLEEISQMQNLLAGFAQEEKRPVGRPKKKTAQEES